MKSKLFLMMSVLVVALMFTTSANAQVRGEKVYLPCSGNETWSNKTGLLYESIYMTNNTGGWLAQGKTIYSQLTGYSVAPYSPHVFKIEEHVLAEMVPDGALIYLGTSQFKYSEFGGPWVCKIWYLK